MIFTLANHPISATRLKRIVSRRTCLGSSTRQPPNLGNETETNIPLLSAKIHIARQPPNLGNETETENALPSQPNELPRQPPNLGNETETNIINEKSSKLLRSTRQPPNLGNETETTRTSYFLYNDDGLANHPISATRLKLNLRLWLTDGKIARQPPNLGNETETSIDSVCAHDATARQPPNLGNETETT